MRDFPSFVHLTDLHIGNTDGPNADPSATVAAILRDVKDLHVAPDFIVVSGDLTHHGDVASYGEVKRLFQESGLTAPVLWALGNHDKRHGFYRGLLGRSYDLEAPYCHHRVIANLHVIVLDTSVPERIGGDMSGEQFVWLEAALKAHPGLPKLIVAHHPPALDEDDAAAAAFYSLSGEATVRLRETLAGHDVVGLICGHIHYDRVSLWHGIPVVAGIGQNAATDVLALHEGHRTVAGTSFGIGVLRPSGLTLSFIPQLRAGRVQAADIAAE